MLKTIIIASSLALSGAAFAQTQQNEGEKSLPAAPAASTTTAPAPAMQQKNTGMPGNSTTKGAPKANTGTGGPGGTGNE
jgi:hypothetical protein